MGQTLSPSRLSGSPSAPHSCAESERRGICITWLCCFSICCRTSSACWSSFTSRKRQSAHEVTPRNTKDLTPVLAASPWLPAPPRPGRGQRRAVGSGQRCGRQRGQGRGLGGRTGLVEAPAAHEGAAREAVQHRLAEAGHAQRVDERVERLARLGGRHPPARRASWPRVRCVVTAASWPWAPRLAASWRGGVGSAEQGRPGSRLGGVREGQGARALLLSAACCTRTATGTPTRTGI